MRLGRFEIDPVAEFEGPRATVAAFFPSLDLSRAEPALDRLPPGTYDPATGMLATSIHSWLIRMPGVVLLLDTCFGNGKHRPAFPNFHMRSTDWLDRLASLGIRPDDVTHVINTHLHADHVGWNTVLRDGAWRPTFQRATYLLPAGEVRGGAAASASWNAGAFEDSVRPILDAGQAELIDPPHEIVPGLRLIPAPGHSPAMMILEALANGDGALLGGDPIHHVLQLAFPGVSSRFCEDLDTANRTRAALLERCVQEGLWLGACHLLAPRLLRVKRQGAAYAMRD